MSQTTGRQKRSAGVGDGSAAIQRMCGRRLLRVIGLTLLISVSVVADGGAEYPDGTDECRGGYLLQGLESPFQCGLNFTVFEDARGMILFEYLQQNNTVRFGIQTPTQGWIALGFQTEEMATGMIGAKAVIGTPGHVRGYSLAGKSLDSVVEDPSATDSIKYWSFMLDPVSGLSSMEFTIALNTTTLPILTDHRTYFIWAVGSSTALAMHGDSGSGLSAVINSAVNTVNTEEVEAYDWERVHGILMATAWALLLPAGAVMARYVSHFGKLMYTLHVAIQVVGIVLTLAGVILILCTSDLEWDWFTDYSKADVVHGQVGIVVMVLVMLQPLNGLFRPGAGVSPQRRSWEIAHLVIGKLSLGLAFFNMFFGVYIYTIVSARSYWAYWAVPMAASLFVIYLTQSVTDKVLHHKALMREEQEMARRIQEAGKAKV